MNIGIIGATGKAGKLITEEALKRGHKVTAIVRDASKVDKAEVSVVEKNIFEITAEDMEPYEVVVNAFGSAEGEPYVKAANVLIPALQKVDTKLFVVGGAASLFVDEDKTTRLIDTPEFPDAYKPMAGGMAEQLTQLEQAEGITWTFLSPPAVFDADGVKTGSYETGKDHLLVNKKGDSYISYPDYAVAVLDEIEHPQHVNERFTIVGEAE
ncbi:NAD(P)-dependent oxidoreductase [Sinobaca sp. H24]|uniref:NAD(P)-dependent oxidoreductase n=1 Tax=Sinobaca sp. H24 TaxID=2923376 RepID=UPI00207A8628|nr:NAD(P)-dependent oxidoreductase [Sinobaca sp. H24]